MTRTPTLMFSGRPASGPMGGARPKVCTLLRAPVRVPRFIMCGRHPRDRMSCGTRCGCTLIATSVGFMAGRLRLGLVGFLRRVVGARLVRMIGCCWGLIHILAHSTTMVLRGCRVTMPRGEPTGPRRDTPPWAQQA